MYWTWAPCVWQKWFFQKGSQYKCRSWSESIGRNYFLGPSGACRQAFKAIFEDGLSKQQNSNWCWKPISASFFVFIDNALDRSQLLFHPCKNSRALFWHGSVNNSWRKSIDDLLLFSFFTALVRHYTLGFFVSALEWSLSCWLSWWKLGSKVHIMDFTLGSWSVCLDVGWL